ncbi:hypothetical protein CRENBAI_022879 [Crenichthys baileyi]|uniref:Uncharacterized protein n=1 Tax=Crenichthys baileyi TaxID=28760 RepID=A0AAV9RBW9_9TELE
MIIRTWINNWPKQLLNNWRCNKRAYDMTVSCTKELCLKNRMEDGTRWAVCRPIFTQGNKVEQVIIALALRCSLCSTERQSGGRNCLYGGLFVPLTLQSTNQFNCFMVKSDGN